MLLRCSHCGHVSGQAPLLSIPCDPLPSLHFLNPQSASGRRVCLRCLHAHINDWRPETLRLSQQRMDSSSLGVMCCCWQLAGVEHKWQCGKVWTDPRIQHILPLHVLVLVLIVTNQVQSHALQVLPQMRSSYDKMRLWRCHYV